MTKILTSVLFMVFAVSGCVDNEKSFYIEHAKSYPDPPKCKVSTGDPVSPSTIIDLSLASEGGIWKYFYVTNAIMSKKDYDNLEAESNGIIVDGYELSTELAGQGSISGTEFYKYNHFIPPESSDVLYANLVSANSLVQLQNHMHCLRNYTLSQIKDAILSGNTAVLNDLNQASQDVISGYANIKYLGHTQGGKDVETQTFSHHLNFFCGPAGGWTPCFEDPCYAFCNKEATIEDSCVIGVGQIMTCSDLLTVVGDLTGDWDNDASTPPTDYCKSNCTAE
jgi:hypothetical protein